MCKCNFLQLPTVIQAQQREGPHTGMQASVRIFKVHCIQIFAPHRLRLYLQPVRHTIEGEGGGLQQQVLERLLMSRIFLRRN